MKVERLRSIARGFMAFAVIMMSNIGSVMAGGAGGGNGGAEFTEIRTTIEGWITGELGLMIIFIGFLVAAISALVTRSLMVFLFVFGLAITLAYGPAVITGVFGAGLPVTI